MAQHHGLPTRLLDWTQNLLVALFFAVSQDLERDGEIIALHAPKQLPRTVREGLPFNIRRPYKFYPNIVSRRIQAQEGLFVVCSQPYESLESQLPDDWKIIRHKIPASSKEKILYQLFRLGIHKSSLFPDVDGLAARIKWQHSTNPLAREAEDF